MSVIVTSSSVIYIRRVRFPHAKCDFYTQSVHECDYDTQDYDLNTLKVVFYTYEYENDTHECDYDTLEWDYETPECDLYTQSAIFTQKVWVLYVESKFYT
jgi:hypothetical protein